ncbi:MAG TPA: hypothetical protein VGF55_31500 [Gemmataceae bacterium]|jgi:hypothetical protein
MGGDDGLRTAAGVPAHLREVLSAHMAWAYRIVPVGAEGGTVVLVSDRVVRADDLEFLTFARPGLARCRVAGPGEFRDVRADLDRVLSQTYPPRRE